MYYEYACQSQANSYIFTTYVVTGVGHAWNHERRLTEVLATQSGLAECLAGPVVNPGRRSLLARCIQLTVVVVVDDFN